MTGIDIVRAELIAEDPRTALLDKCESLEAERLDELRAVIAKDADVLLHEAARLWSVFVTGNTASEWAVAMDFMDAAHVRGWVRVAKRVRMDRADARVGGTR